MLYRESTGAGDKDMLSLREHFILETDVVY